MNRDHYHALRRAAYAATVASYRQAADDGRSSYGSHSIRCLHASRAAEAALASVPRDPGNSLETVRRIARRRRVLFCIQQRNHARRFTPACTASYTRDIRSALIPLEVRHVRIGTR